MATVREVAIPTLVLAGTASPSSSSTLAETWRSSAPQALERLDGADHGASAAAVAPAVSAFAGDRAAG